MYGEDTNVPAPSRREGDKFALLISGFPALGKSRLTGSNEEPPELIIRSNDGRKEERARIYTLPSCGLDFPVYDIDSGRYKLGTLPDVAAFMDIVNKACKIPRAILLVGAKWQFRQAMQDAGLEYLRLYPKASLKESWLLRQDSRLQRSQKAVDDAEEVVKEAKLCAARLREEAQAMTGDDAARLKLLEEVEACEQEAAEWADVLEFALAERATHAKLRNDMDSYWDFWMEIERGFPGEQIGNKVVFGSNDHLTLPGCFDAVMKRFALCDPGCEKTSARHHLRDCVDFGQPVMEWCEDYDQLE